MSDPNSPFNPAITMRPGATPSHSREEREAFDRWLAHVVAGRIGTKAPTPREIRLKHLRKELLLFPHRVRWGEERTHIPFLGIPGDAA